MFLLRNVLFKFITFRVKTLKHVRTFLFSGKEKNKTKTNIIFKIKKKKSKQNCTEKYNFFNIFRILKNNYVNKELYIIMALF